MNKVQGVFFQYHKSKKVATHLAKGVRSITVCEKGDKKHHCTFALCNLAFQKFFQKQALSLTYIRYIHICLFIYSSQYIVHYSTIYSTRKL